MKFPNKELIESLRKHYPAGARVVLDHMEDVQAPPIGIKGTVQGVDDIGSILVKWDDGGSLSVVFGEDRCHVVKEG